MSNVVMVASDGQEYIVPEGTPQSEVHKGIPVAVDLSFLNFPVEWELRFKSELKKRKLISPEDFEKPGAYKEVADALRALLKVSANDIVDSIRRTNNA